MRLFGEEDDIIYHFDEEIINFPVVHHYNYRYYSRSINFEIKNTNNLQLFNHIIKFPLIYKQLILLLNKFQFDDNQQITNLSSYLYKLLTNDVQPVSLIDENCEKLYTFILNYKKIDGEKYKNITSIGEMEECSICLCDLNQGGVCLTRCFHVFHRECIEKHLRHKSNCPLCRFDFN